MDINALNTTDISEKGVVIEIVDESGLSDGTTVTMRGVDSEVWQRHQSKITGYRNIENMHGRVPDDKKIEGMYLDAVVDCAMDWSGWTNGLDENGKPVPVPFSKDLFRKVLKNSPLLQDQVLKKMVSRDFLLKSKNGMNS